jgi:hypothetical protein
MNDRLKKLTKELAIGFYTMEHLDLSGDNIPPEYFEVDERRGIFKTFSTDLIALLVEQGRSDDEVRSYMEWFHSVEQGDFRSALLPALRDGESRFVFTKNELLDFYKDGRADVLLGNCDLTTRLCADGRFAVDITFKTGSTSRLNIRKASEIEPTIKAAGGAPCL